MIVPVMAISNLVLTQQIYSEETNGAHAHYSEPVPLTQFFIAIWSQRDKIQLQRISLTEIDVFWSNNNFSAIRPPGFRPRSLPLQLATQVLRVPTTRSIRDQNVKISACVGFRAD